MAIAPICPRCTGELRPPGLSSSQWRCAAHGPVPPFTVCQRVGQEVVDAVIDRARVPVWVPRPMPAGWVVSGVAYAGDERTGALATVTACSGPGPLGGAADLLIVAEEPGVGVGARYAGLGGSDPGTGFDQGPPEAKVEASGHVTPLWSLPATDDCAPFVGEAKGLWLWVLACPGRAGVLLYEQLMLRDLRDGEPMDLGFGALTPRLG